MLAQKMNLKNAKVASTRLGQIKKQMEGFVDAKVKSYNPSSSSSAPASSPTMNKAQKKNPSPTKASSTAGVKKTGGEKRGRKPKYLKLDKPEIKKEVENIRNDSLIRTPISDDGGESEYESIQVKQEETVQYDE